jgi:competence protein ComEC
MDACWLQYWKPRTAIIPVGSYNSYGHPNPQVIERLRDSAADIYRTDLHGEIQMRVSENSLKIRTKIHK